MGFGEVEGEELEELEDILAVVLKRGGDVSRAVNCFF